METMVRMVQRSSSGAAKGRNMQRHGAPGHVRLRVDPKRNDFEEI